ncbi:ATP-dependent helicase, partial [Microbacterium sp.]
MARTYQLKRTAKTAAPTFDRDALNPQQRAVVEAAPGHALVIAGAGSGKTRTLIYRVAHLNSTGTPADRILLLTFTNRAAREMTRRTEELLKGGAKRMWSGTFHSIGRRILRANAERLGYPAEFTILDTEDANDVMSQAITDVVNKATVRLPKPNTLRNIVSQSINTGVSITEVLAVSYPSFQHLDAAIHEVLGAYQARKFQTGAMDYDDLLLYWRQLFIDHPEVRERYAGRFLHVLVDEYQDTNRLQADLVAMMAGTNKSLMVVGDDCQSIYAFRGAEYRNILDFAEHYPDTTTYRLERNYRSSPEIVALANASIANNTLQHEKTLFSHEPSGPIPAVVSCKNEQQEAAFVAERILDLLDEGVELKQIAVLYRAHWMSMQLQTDLNRLGIPYVVRSGVRFFEQRHIKDVLAFIRYAVNPADELAFLRLVKLGDGIGSVTARRIFENVSARGGLQAVRDPEVLKGLSSRARPSWNTLSDILLRLNSPALRANAGTAIDV